MAVTNVTADVEPILNNWYVNSYEDLTYRDHPLMGKVKKVPSGGKTINVRMKYGQNAGRSAAFATAQANESLAKRKEFTVNHGIDYSLTEVPNPDIEYASSDRGAVVRLLSDEMESANRNLADSVERDLFGNGYGTLGRIKTGGISSATVTLGSGTVSLPMQGINFFPGQKVVFASAENAAALRNSGSALTVLSVDLDAGTVTFTANVATLNEVIVGDYMFAQGDKTTATQVKLVGLRGWLPLTAPTGGDSFFGVDRSVSPTLLAGWRIDGRGKKLTEVINALATRISTMAGSRPDSVFMAPTTFEKFTNLLDSKVIFDSPGRDVDIGFSAIQYMSVKGKLDVMSSPFCDEDRLYVLDTSSFELGSPGNQVIKSANHNGKVVDVGDADAVEIRLRALAAFYCTAPAYNGVAQIL